MAGGLFALLDDVAAMARLAAASIDDVGAAAGRATVKTAGVVVDDAAVTPQYVQGLAAERELPIIKKIAIGSIRNKLLLILPAAILMSEFLPWLLTPILMLGGCYLSYEAIHKIWGAVRGHDAHESDKGAKNEDSIVSGAVRTDLILSAEIMVIALNEVADEGIWSRIAILLVVAFIITFVVYGVVGLIVKMDDVGLRLSQGTRTGVQRFGRFLVNAMPKVLQGLTVIGTAAMLWVGGHILLVGIDDLGWHAVYDLVHHIEDDIKRAVSFGGAVLAWCANTAASAILGAVAGSILVVALSPFHKDDSVAH